MEILGETDNWLSTRGVEKVSKDIKNIDEVLLSFNEVKELIGTKAAELYQGVNGCKEAFYAVADIDALKRKQLFLTRQIVVDILKQRLAMYEAVDQHVCGNTERILLLKDLIKFFGGKC
jgi:hypothetical protein